MKSFVSHLFALSHTIITGRIQISNGQGVLAKVTDFVTIYRISEGQIALMSSSLSNIW